MLVFDAFMVDPRVCVFVTLQSIFRCHSYVTFHVHVDVYFCTKKWIFYLYCWYAKLIKNEKERNVRCFKFDFALILFRKLVKIAHSGSLACLFVVKYKTIRGQNQQAKFIHMDFSLMRVGSKCLYFVKLSSHLV